MRLLVVGDVMLGRLVNEMLKHEPAHYPWGDTLPIFRSVDVRISNLECVIAAGGTPWTETPKTFHFRSDPKNVTVLEAAGMDCVSLANNHTLDYGYEAMFEMLDVLDKAAIYHAGAGANLQSASSPALFTRSGLRIGCIAFTDNEPAWEATADRAGVFYVPVNLRDRRARVLLDTVLRTKAQVDLLIVNAHWGPNWGYRPQPAHVPFAHTLIEYGADIVVGHSCHVFQGIELYRSRPILYSCGDFVDDYRVDEHERNDQSFIFIFDLEGTTIQRLRLYPTVIRRSQAHLAKGNEADAIVSKMQALCAELGTSFSWKGEYLEIRLPAGAR